MLQVSANTEYGILSRRGRECNYPAQKWEMVSVLIWQPVVFADLSMANGDPQKVCKTGNSSLILIEKNLPQFLVSFGVVPSDTDEMTEGTMGRK